MQGEIAKALPSVITPERFTRITLSALSTNPQLQQCTPGSFLGAMMTAAQLGLEPNTPLGQAYLIPFRNKGVLECQFQLGYKGLLDLAYRSGEISVIQAHTVYAKDEFEYELGLEPKLKHKPHMGADKGEPIAFYALFRTKDGGFGFEVMSVEDVRAHAKKFSQSYGKGFSPWDTNFAEMAKKTVLKKVLKYAPLKSDFVRQAATDETIKTEIGEDMTEINPIQVEAEIVDSETGEVTESK
jgi:recombination protein RecT